MKKLFVFTALASALMAGCSNEEASVATSATNELGVSAISISGAAGTRALTDVFANTNQIGIFINGLNYTPLVAKYTVDGSSAWSSPADLAKKIYLSNDVATVYGFYPADATATLDNVGASTIAITVPATEASFNAANQADYMYATAPSADAGLTYPLATATNATSENKQKVSLIFHHALSKVSFVIKRHSTYTGVGALTEVKLTSTDVAKPFSIGAGTMKVADGAITLASTSTDLTFTGTKTINEAASNAYTVEELVAPKASAEAITLYLIIDGKEMSTVLPTTLVTSWIKEKNYVYTVTVSGTELIVTSVSILNWTEVASGDTNVN